MSADQFDHDQAGPPQPLPEGVPTTVPQPTTPVSDQTIDQRQVAQHAGEADTAPGNFAAPPQDMAYDEEDGSEEVDFAAAAQEDGAPEAASKDEQEQEDVLDVIEPKAAPKQWVIGPEDMPLTFVQKPLGFLQKMQWFALVGEVLDKAMTGDGGLSLNDLLSAPDGVRTQARSVADFRDADTFVRALGKLVNEAPTFLIKSYCIWLGVPKHQWKLVEEIFSLPVDEGGLSDEDGLEIIEIFIDQNYDALADFFGGKVSALQRRVSARQQEREAKKKRRVRA